MSQEIEFEVYVSDEIGHAVLVVEYNEVPALPGAESDWDAHKYLEIISAEAFKGGKKIDIDIDLIDLYPIVSARIRSLGIEQVLGEEDEGF